MKIEKITPQIAALYLGQKCDMKFHKLGKSEVKITVGRIGLLERDAITMTPHLRRLESITEEECKYLFELINGSEYDFHESHSYKEDWWQDFIDIDFITANYFFIGNPFIWLYLLSRGFDLFSLIEQGLAEEITTQTNEL